MAEKLTRILQSYVADGDDTKGKVLGASLVIVDAHGKKSTYISLVTS
jgi:hypothetical protein